MLTQYTPGTRVGKYEVRSEVGRGAMGEVYVARDTVLEREVALKVMADSISDSDLKERFVTEAKAVARLQHPNIVTVYDFGHDAHGAAFIAMELLKGQDLERRLRQGAPSLVEALEVVAQVCRGLAHAHTHHIVHRDVKPANVFVTGDGLVKIMDFGVARWAQSAQKTRTGTVMGTATYMSPEQLRGQKIDGRSDIFSLGVLLYRLLSGRQPFTGDDIHRIFFQILNTRPPPLLLDGEHVPELQQILDRALEKSADDRYPTAGEMAEDLVGFLRLLGGTQALAGEVVFSTLPAAPAGAATLPAATQGQRPMREAPTVRAEPVETAIETPATSPAAPPTAAARESSWSSRWTAGVAIVLIALAVVLGPELYRRLSSSPPPDVVAAAPPTLPGPAATTVQDPVSESSEAPPPVASPPPAPAASPPPPATATPPPPPPSLPPPPDPAAEARQLAGQARTALAASQLEHAGQLIEQGRRLDPSNPVWGQLAGEMDQRRRQIEDQRLAQERARGYVQEGLDRLDTDDYEKAVAAFRKALVHDPGNARAVAGLEQAESLERDQKRRTIPAPAARRGFSETPTTFAPAGGSNDGGFVMDENVAVEKATADVTSPGELLIEINPPDVKASEPFNLTVRLHNESNKALFVKDLEIVTAYGGRKLGAGAKIVMNLRRVDARSTVVLHQVSGTWREEQSAGGSITVTATLPGGRLVKTLKWAAP